MNARIYRYLVCGLLFAFFFGCTPVPSVVPTVTPTLLRTNDLSATPVPLPTQTASAVPRANPPLHFFYPKIEKICPEKREVSIDKLGITGDLKIILSDSNQRGLWTLDIENPSPQLIRKLPLDKWTSKSISPDGKRLAYTIWNLDHSLSTWLLSLDSGEQREIVNINNLEGAFLATSWLSPNELLIVGSCTGAGCPFPLQVVNISTGDSKEASSIDRDPYDEYQTFYADAGNYYALYSKGNVGDDYTDFYIYDYLFHQKIRVFPWLQNKIFFTPILELICKLNLI